MDPQRQQYGDLMHEASQLLRQARRTALAAGQLAYGLGFDRGACCDLRGELQQSWLTGWDDAAAGAAHRSEAARLAMEG